MYCTKHYKLSNEVELQNNSYQGTEQWTLFFKIGNTVIKI